MRFHVILFLAISLPAAGLAETAFVTDQFEITLRSGPSTANTIVRLVASGAAVEVLEANKETGYSRVSIGPGIEGYVLSRYLMDQRSARDQLTGMRQQLSKLRQRNQDMGAQLAQTTASRDELSEERDRLMRDNRSRSADLEKIKKVSANAIKLDRQNQELQTSVQTLKHKLQSQASEIQSLKDKRNRDWFLAGAAVLIGGILMGLFLPKIRLRRRSSWSDF